MAIFIKSIHRRFAITIFFSKSSDLNESGAILKNFLVVLKL
jgi:hypothetical protein